MSKTSVESGSWFCFFPEREEMTLLATDAAVRYSSGSSSAQHVCPHEELETKAG